VTCVEIAASAGKPAIPRGAVGRVIRAPADDRHSYWVRLPEGVEAALRQEEFRVRKQHQSEGLVPLENAGPAVDLFEYVIYRCVVGSRAYGLEEYGSDTDWRGIYLPPAERHWSLSGVPEQIENTATEECYWELQKFLRLALKANPNVLECL